ncbi:zinc finger (Ran-binding) family protein, partial [Klebsormidium nitens]
GAHGEGVTEEITEASALG